MIVATGIQIYQELALLASNIERIKLKSFQPARKANFGEIRGSPNFRSQNVEDHLLLAIDPMEKFGVRQPLPCAATHGTDW